MIEISCGVGFWEVGVIYAIKWLILIRFNIE